MPEKKFQLVPTKTFLKDLKKVDPKLKRRIAKALDNLQENPFVGRGDSYICASRTLRDEHM